MEYDIICFSVQFLVDLTTFFSEKSNSNLPKKPNHFDFHFFFNGHFLLRDPQKIVEKADLGRVFN